MKPTGNAPIFRNCPYADIFNSQFHSDCRRCELYETCVERKAKRQKNKRRKARKQYLFITAITAILLLSVMAIIIHINPFKEEEKEEDILEPNYTQVICDIKAVNNIPEKAKIQSEKVSVTTISHETTIPQIESNVSEETIEEQPVEQIEEQQAEKLEEKMVEQPEILQEAIPTISAYGPGTVYYYILSDADKKDIEKLVYKEARGEPYEGKVAVAAVVLNRFFSGDPRFNRDSIHSVIIQSGAFADISDVTQSMLDTVPDLKDAVEDACRGWDPTRTTFENGALFFYAPKEVVGYQKEIREGIEVLQIGNHNFHNDFND